MPRKRHQSSVLYAAPNSSQSSAIFAKPAPSPQWIKTNFSLQPTKSSGADSAKDSNGPLGSTAIEKANKCLNFYSKKSRDSIKSISSALNLYGPNLTQKGSKSKSISEKTSMTKYKSNKPKSLSLCKFILNVMNAKKNLHLTTGTQLFR